MTNSNSRYKVVRYGLCLNDNCSKSKTKEKQQINGHKDFVCEECGKPLRECPPPRSWWNKNGKVLLGALATVVVLGVGSFFIISEKNGSNTETPIRPSSDKIEETLDKSVQVTTEAPAKPVQVTEKKADVPMLEKKVVKPVKRNTVSTSKSLDLGYATYVGRVKNGLPYDESGRMTFKEKHLIDKRDSQKRMAEPGDYIIGEYVNGKLVQGVWYNKKNIVKGSIIIGL